MASAVPRVSPILMEARHGATTQCGCGEYRGRARLPAVPSRPQSLSTRRDGATTRTRKPFTIGFLSAGNGYADQEGLRPQRARIGQRGSGSSCESPALITAPTGSARVKLDSGCKENFLNTPLSTICGPHIGSELRFDSDQRIRTWLRSRRRTCRSQAGARGPANVLRESEAW